MVILSILIRHHYQVSFWCFPALHYLLYSCWQLYTALSIFFRLKSDKNQSRIIYFLGLKALGHQEKVLDMDCYCCSF